MVVLEKPLSKAYPEIDMVTTPVGDDVAMVHVNNCTSDLNAWVNIFREYSAELGIEISTESYTAHFTEKLLKVTQTAEDFFLTDISRAKILQVLKKAVSFSFVHQTASLHLQTS